MLKFFKRIFNLLRFWKRPSVHGCYNCTHVAKSCYKFPCERCPHVNRKSWEWDYLNF